MEKRIYIIGAGFAGQTIADDIKRKKIFGKVNAFIDDNKDLIGTVLAISLSRGRTFVDVFIEMMHLLLLLKF